MFLYNTGVALYTLVIHISAVFNPKAKLWVKGRENWKTKFTAEIEKLGQAERVWVHCASLGEFEQGRPVIEKIKQLYPEKKIILTFFSPSGYEIRKNYELADLICYLPPDSPSNARDFINVCNPKSVIFVKYEFWLNYLFELKRKNIPTFLISAIFKNHQPFFKWYGSNFRKGLNAYTTIFVQDNNSQLLLKSLSVNTGLVCGDTRIDRVLKIKETASEIEMVRKFCETSFTLIAGSSWPKDDELLLKAFSQLQSRIKNLKLVIVPHEVDPKNISNLEHLIKQQKINYSLFSKNAIQDTDSILVIDTIGILSSIYKYANIAYIGGGFDNGIHNILEPAVYGLPVLFGPNHIKFNEATELILCGGAFEIESMTALANTVESLAVNKELFKKSSEASINYILKSEGATKKIIDQVFKRI